MGNSFGPKGLAIGSGRPIGALTVVQLECVLFSIRERMGSPTTALGEIQEALVDRNHRGGKTSLIELYALFGFVLPKDFDDCSEGGFRTAVRLRQYDWLSSTN